jgi:hypothetical protein
MIENTRIPAGVFVCLAVAKMRFVAMNTGQQAERFIHATVAWNKAVCAEPYLQ